MQAHSKCEESIRVLKFKKGIEMKLYCNDCKQNKLISEFKINQNLINFKNLMDYNIVWSI